MQKKYSANRESRMQIHDTWEWRAKCASASEGQKELTKIKNMNNLLSMFRWVGWDVAFNYWPDQLSIIIFFIGWWL
jgi:hypothetical protein